MSRIGKLPIEVPSNVEVKISADNVVSTKGPLGELSVACDKGISFKQEGSTLVVERSSENKKFRALHGLYRALVANNIEGVTKGYTKELIVNGVGYKVIKQGNKLVLHVGYSHTVEFEAPEGITLELTSPTEIVVKGIDKAQVGQCAANIKKIRKPDPYHIYGIRYKDEVIIKKEGKTK